MKFSKKLLDRQFSLGMILLYCIKHTNHHTVAPIIAMLNWFLRNLGDSTQEERDSIDQVEYKLLYHIVPGTVCRTVCTRTLKIIPCR